MPPPISDSTNVHGNDQGYPGGRDWDMTSKTNRIPGVAGAILLITLLALGTGWHPDLGGQRCLLLRLRGHRHRHSLARCRVRSTRQWSRKV